jgi:hypothetical protein
MDAIHLQAREPSRSRRFRRDPEEGVGDGLHGALRGHACPT